MTVDFVQTYEEFCWTLYSAPCLTAISIPGENISLFIQKKCFVDLNT